MRRIGISLAAVCCAGVFVGRPAHAGIVYDNTTTSTGSTSFSQLEIGDEVNADGDMPFVWNLFIGVTTKDGLSGTADLQVRLYANDGPGGEPGTLLWEGPVLDDVLISPEPRLIQLGGPAMFVPDTFTWTVQISDVQPGAVGLPHFDPPSHGTSPAYAWVGEPGSWTRLSDPGGLPVNFMAHMNNVDCEPCNTNCDRGVDAFDIEPFLELLFDPNAQRCAVCAGDVDGNGVVDAFDIAPFLDCLFP